MWVNYSHFYFMKRTNITAEQAQEIISYYLAPHSLNETSYLFNINKSRLKQLFEEYNILLHSNLVVKQLNILNMQSGLSKKYGKKLTSPIQLDWVKNKVKNTCLQKYGVEYSCQSNNNKEKAKKTKLIRYNSTTFNNRTKARQTCIEKYGVDYATKTAETKAKYKQTCLQKYNVTNFAKTDLFKTKLKVINKNRLDKSYNTKHKNGTFNTSSTEKRFYEYLLTKYPKEDIFQQYTDPRYPFICDFYIKSKDLFIELNLHWTHGGKPFNKATDYTKVAVWNEKAKTSKFYQNAIKTWTVRDVNKLSYFKQNKLNYKIFYSIEELPF